MTIKDINPDKVYEMTGYRPFTTFYSDFSIADNFGLSAIKDTYNRAFEDWKSDVKYFTELVLVLNWKCWEHYDNSKPDYSSLYSDLYYKARDYALENFKGDDFDYFYSVTD